MDENPFRICGEANDIVPDEALLFSLKRVDSTDIMQLRDDPQNNFFDLDETTAAVSNRGFNNIVAKHSQTKDLVHVCRSRMSHRIHCAASCDATQFGVKIDRAYDTMIRSSQKHEVRKDKASDPKKTAKPHKVCYPEIKSNPLPPTRFYNNYNVDRYVDEQTGEYVNEMGGQGIGYGSSAGIFGFTISKREQYVICLSDAGHCEAQAEHAHMHKELSSLQVKKAGWKAKQDAAELLAEQDAESAALAEQEANDGYAAADKEYDALLARYLVRFEDVHRLVTMDYPDESNGYFLAMLSQKEICVAVARFFATIRCSICMAQAGLLSTEQMRIFQMRICEHAIQSRYMEKAVQHTKGDKNLGRDWAVGPLQAYKNINTISIDDRDYKTILAENKKTRAAKAEKAKAAAKEKKKAETSSARAPHSPRHRSASLDSTQPIERQHVTQKRRRQNTFENDENIRPVKRSLLQDDSSQLLTLAQTTLPMQLHDNTPPIKLHASMTNAPVASHSARPVKTEVADSSNQVQRLCLSNIGSLQANRDDILETSSTQAVDKPTNAVVKTKEEMHISSNNMPSQVQHSQSDTSTMLNEDFMSPAVETDFPTHLIKPIVSIEVFADQTPEGVKSETEMQVASYNSIIAVQRSQSNSPTRLNLNVDFSRGYLLPPADLNDSPAQPTTTETKIEVTDHESMLAQKSCSRNSHSLVNDANGSLAIGTTQSSNRISLDHRPLSVVGYQLCEPATNFVVFWSQGGIADVGSLMLASSNRSILVATESVDEICRRKNNTNVVQCTLETENSGHIKINVLTFGKKPLPFSSHMAYPIKDFESYINLYMRLNNATNLTHITRYESDISAKGLYQTLCNELSGNVIGTNCDMLIPSNDV